MAVGREESWSPCCVSIGAQISVRGNSGKLLPVVELEIRIGDRDGCAFQIADGSRDISGRHVVTRVAIESNNKNAAVMASGCKNHEFVKSFEVLVVARHERTLLADCMGKMDLIAGSRQPDVGGYLDVMTVQP